MGEHFKEAFSVCKQSLIAVAIFSGVANLLMLTPAFFMLNVYDKAVGSNSMDTLWVLSGLTVFLFLILAAMDALRALVLVKVSGRIDQVLASPVYLKTFQTAATGGSQAATVQALSDLTALRQFITSADYCAIRCALVTHLRSGFVCFQFPTRLDGDSCRARVLWYRIPEPKTQLRASRSCEWIQS